MAGLILTNGKKNRQIHQNETPSKITHYNTVLLVHYLMGSFVIINIVRIGPLCCYIIVYSIIICIISIISFAMRNMVAPA